MSKRWSARSACRRCAISLDVGREAPLHAFAAGKALLAALDDDALDDYLAQSDSSLFRGRALTPNTVIGADALRAEVAAIHTTGFARTIEEYTPGIAGIARAAAIDGRIVGAFSVALPLVRLTADVARRIEDHLTRATAILGKAAGPGADRPALPVR